MPVRRVHIFLLFSLALFFICQWAHAGIHHADVEDNEFAEFEDFETEEETAGFREKEDDSTLKSREEPPSDGKERTVVIDDEDEATIETEDNEFEHVDEEEFEGFDGERPKSDPKSTEGPKITFAKLPAHLRSNWESYYLELLILAGLMAYFINFFMGRAKNQKIAETWYAAFESLLQDNFALVGDDGKIENSHGGLMKESENVYLLWCSGRTCCEAVLIELRLIKRQDLVSVLGSIFRPQCDQVHIKVFMNQEDMDSYVMCLSNKKFASKLAKDMADISVFCPEKKSVEKYNLPSNFVLMSEIGEAATTLLDPRLCALVNKIPDVIEALHFSDQYSGLKQTEEAAPTKMPDTRKMLLFTFNLHLKSGKQSLRNAL